MYFDTHAHYDDDAFAPDRDEVLQSLAGQGIELAVDPGCDLPSSRSAVALAERYPFLYAAVGIHPENCAGFQDSDLDALRALAREHRKVRAIGEIGLDYYWPENPPKAFQQEVFRKQLALAQELGLPVIVHNREAHADCMSIVREHPGVQGVYHCYSGAVEDAKTLVRMGWMLSFTGVITYKSARKALEVIEWAPLESIMIETDSPYLPPTPHRGERNDSRNVPLVAAKIAEIKGLTQEQVAAATLANGRRFFRIP